MIDSPLPPFTLAGRTLLPVIQGGMGIGISAHSLAGAVAREGAVGTISSIDLRRHHPDLMERTGKSRDPGPMDVANLEALDREVRAARAIAGPRGFIAVNVMKAVRQHAALVRQACESGADAIVVGAGLPLDLPEMVADHPNVALIPILSEERGVRAVVRKWMRAGRLPAAIVIEQPKFAGGHLGSPKIADVADARFEFERVHAGIRGVLDDLGTGPIPLVAAGGIHTHERIVELIAAGWSAVQVGTPFAVTREGDAHERFKHVLADARPEDIVTFLSAAGLPARAVRTPWLASYLEREDDLRAAACPEKAACVVGMQCLNYCGLRDGDPAAGQFCIDLRLAAALRGDVEEGLFFRGSEPLPFGREIRSVHDLLTYLLTGRDAVAEAVARN
ncbi:MAG: nitronate monooxygenase family protein [Planctomycetes bacterium]|nr:nitronate monooxygenase family protein [Planctomycetota bacterium]